jgi:hypothetical protein
LAGDAYVRIEADDAGCLVSDELGLRLCVGEGVLQFYRLDTGQRLLTRGEQTERETAATFWSAATCRRFGFRVRLPSFLRQSHERPFLKKKAATGRRFGFRVRLPSFLRQLHERPFLKKKAATGRRSPKPAHVWLRPKAALGFRKNLMQPLRRVLPRL